MIRDFTRLINEKLFWVVYKYKPIFMFPFPGHIALDGSTHCNLNCPGCFTGRGKKGMTKGFLKFDDFKKFINKNSWFISTIYLSNWGEIFFNPEIFKIIEYAKAKDIYIYADTNLNHFNDDFARQIVTSKIDKLIISVDGTSNESYQKYRRGGNFETVISNIKKINNYKKQLNSKKPELVWKFIVFQHNQNQIEEAKKLARDLNMSFRLDSNCLLEQAGLVTDINIGDPIIMQSTDLSREKYTENDTVFCHQLWHQPAINYNGNMLGCCMIFDEKYSLGNVFKNSFFKVYNSKKMRNLRKSVLGKTKKPAYLACLSCIFPDRNYSMLSIEQHINIYKLINVVIEQRIEGDIVELGSYDGLSSILLQNAIELFNSDKELHVFDSFQGLPKKSKEDINTEYDKGWCKATKDDLISNFKFYETKLPYIHEGWFKDTLQKHLPKKICFAHLDADFYHSILESLEAVYSRMPKDAVAVIDDYYDDNVHVGKNILPGVKKACDEFFKDKKEKVIPLIAGNKAHAYFIKK